MNYNWLDREGYFKAVVVETGVNKADSGAIGAAMIFQITDQWNPDANEGEGGWDDWRQYAPVRCSGTFWIVKKDGTDNDQQQESLRRAIGWDATLLSLAKDAYQGVEVVIQVKADTYKQQTRFKASWLYPSGHTPGGSLTTCTEEDVAALDAQLSSRFRANVGGIDAAAAKPTGRPASPPPPPPAAASVRSDDGEPPIDEANLRF